ncbi:PilT/PilU family type 4a pilus ATPase [bacterium]|nr:PilT/PilU family type 4a pilus ATPase [bacterium]
MSYSLEQLVKKVMEVNATDLHIKVGSPPMIRVNTILQPAGDEILTPEAAQALIESAMTKKEFHTFQDKLELDFAYKVGNVRFRTNAYFHRGTMAMAMRYNRNDILEFTKLHLPPVVQTIAENERGLILVTGITGSGKSTTLAAMVRHIGRTRRCHIVTVEDPIEYIYEDEGNSIISQREVGHDTHSFLEALKRALRQDPDVMLIGEMRDSETIRAAISAAETGHLVFSTLHTVEAQTTIDRVISFFDGPEQEQVRQQLAANIVAVISQRLLPRSDRPGIIPCLEIMLGTSTVKKLILENKISQLRQAIQNREGGMQTFNQHLLELVNRKIISRDTALANSDNPAALRRMMAGGVSGGDQTGLVGL